MSTAVVESASNVGTGDEEFVTFHVDDLYLGVPIRQVQEINRNLDTNEVPQAPACVRGVINLRGEVVTVVDLRTVLGLPPTRITQRARNIIMKTSGELIGLLVDDVADVVRIAENRIEHPPANVGEMDGRFFRGVYQLESELLAIVDNETVFAVQEGE